MFGILKFIYAVLGSLLFVDLVLMLFNGTLLMLLLALLSLYLMLSIIFGESFFKTLHRWINTGHLTRHYSSTKESNHAQFTSRN